MGLHSGETEELAKLAISWLFLMFLVLLLAAPFLPDEAGEPC